MQIYIISIEDEDSPRWEKFIQQPFFQHPNITYQKIGIKGAEVPTKQYFDLAVKGRSKPLSPGELGCTLSHLKALELFLNTNDKYALIFEDDAIIPQDLSLVDLSTAIEQQTLPNNLLFSLGGIQMKESRKVRGEFKDDFLNKKVLKVIPDFYHRVCYAFAYIVDRSMAETLINYHKQIRKADDWGYLYDFDCSSHLYMTYLVDHPQIDADETDPMLSCLAEERSKSADLKKSNYGTPIKKNLAKIFAKKYQID
ncbi:glycosyl transferase family 25 [Acinetobacter calcoaceticus]|uniref:Glycosyl transferase family 25 n=1 Tax=Acinetobacter calcoaceticus TaxID=471 RepID=A0A4R1XVV5_ACICA|nr:glycosyl transferase family 25 [Acinetobacter calcoaceticus]